MCRLLGYQGGHPRPLKAEILDEPNAILRQSVCDRDVCKPNDDGWGFGYEESGRMSVVKSPTKPATDRTFVSMAERSYRRVMVHIRRASVGSVSLENTHPWAYGQDMIFAHNGSVYGFDRVRDEALGSLPPTLRSTIQGQTDSEFAMAVFLKHAGHHVQSSSVDAMQDALARTVGELREWSKKTGDERLPKLNFMILTKHFLMATRVIHSLGYYLADDGVLITSEALRDGDGWTAMDESSMIVVGPGSRQEVRPL